MRLLFFIIWCAMAVVSMAQTATSLGFIHHSFTTKELGKVDFYVSDTLHRQPKPMLVFLDGSGSRPLYFYQPDESGALQFYSSLPFDLKTLASKYHLVIISKPGIALVDTIGTGPDLTSDSIYNQYASAYWRVEATSKAIDYVMKNYKVDQKQVAVLGFSEGGQVAPRVAVRNKKVTHCIAFVGGGLNQLFDEIIKFRTAGANGQMSPEEAQQQIDTIMAVYADIYCNPTSTQKRWYGHSYLRWASYAAIPTIEFFKQLNIPVFVAQGSADSSTEILSADYIALEFLRLGKKNLTYKPYPGCDHFFTNTATGEQHMHEVVSDALKWLEENR